MPRRVLISALLFALVSLFVWPAAVGAGSARWYPPYPSGAVGVSRPHLGMVLQLSGVRLADAALTVDGQAVPVTPYPWGVEGQPVTPLAVGTHHAQLSLRTTDGWQLPTQEWDFTVVAGPALPDASPTPPRIAALQAANAFRRSVDLPGFQFSPALTQAAQLHAGYEAALTTGPWGHEESATIPGFSGTSPAQRLIYADYDAAASAEGVAWQGQPDQAIAALTTAPYHRLAFLSTNTEMGYAQASGLTVTAVDVLETALPFRLAFSPGVQPAIPAAPGLLVSPFAGQRAVPLSWDGWETPDPYRLHADAPARVADRAQFGYPLVIRVADAGAQQVAFANVQLTTWAGAVVPFWLNTPTNDDELHDTAVVLPKTPLQAATRYRLRATVTWTDAAGTGRSSQLDSWFTTAGGTPPATSEPGIRVTLNGQAVAFDQPPVLQNDRTLVPVRAIAEALGGTVTWDGDREDVGIRLGARQIWLKIDNDRALVQGQPAWLDVPARLIGGRTLVPVRFVAEALGLQVAWQETTETVVLTTR